MLGRAMTVVALLLIALVGVASYLYVADYGVEATVTRKGTDAAGNYLVATTVIGGIEVTHRFDPAETAQWAAVQVGHHVVYHVRSGDVEVFAGPGGPRVYPPA